MMIAAHWDAVFTTLVHPTIGMWMDVAARGCLAGAHIAGLMALAHLIRHRLDVPFSPLFGWIAMFVLADTTGLLLDLLTHWQPTLLLKAIWNVQVVGLSLGLMGAIAWLFPRALQAGALADYLRAETISKLEEEVARRTAELAREKAFAERLIEHVPAGMAFLDRDLVIRRVNPAYLRLRRQAEEELLDKPLFAVTPTGEATLGPLLAQVLNTGVPYACEGFRFGETSQGRPRYWDFSYVPVETRPGESEGILVFALDATHRVETAQLQREQIEHLQAIDRYKDEFLSVISHELRTPLNFIVGFASLLEEEFTGPLTPCQRTHVARILLGADRMLHLVNDLLDVAKLRAGKLELRPGDVDLAPVVDEVLATLRPLATPRGLSLEMAIETPLTLNADRGRLVQVLSNLVSNAIKFTHDGCVTVRAYTAGARAVVEVVDTGPGIAPADLPRLFQHFQQLDMGATRAAGGTGLGLAIVKALIEAHGGSVGVRSELGAGTTFWFSLPLQPSFEFHAELAGAQLELGAPNGHRLT
jgi:PAS domain S-box-containing protein